MKTVSILLLFFCSAASALEALTCQINSTAAAKIAVDHINEHHHHGFKFRQTEVELYETDQTEEHCVMKMKLNLTETKCHVINPKPYEECELRDHGEMRVDANCDVEIRVKGDEGSVHKYNCVTKKDEESYLLRKFLTELSTALVEMTECPDCPTLMNLNDPTGQMFVSKAVEEFNMNTTNDHYYVLYEIGRMKTGYMFGSGMGYYAEFVVVETHCPRGSKIMPQACNPLCPDRARHAFCRSVYATIAGLLSLTCEHYPAKNTAVVEEEPVCRRPDPPSLGPPPHAGSGGPPPDAGSGGPPPHAGSGGPPPHAGSGGPPPHAHGVHPPCPGLIEYDLALHPICPWPASVIGPDPRPSDS